MIRIAFVTRQGAWRIFDVEDSIHEVAPIHTTPLVNQTPFEELFDTAVIIERSDF
jgi:hypothetical protein